MVKGAGRPVTVVLLALLGRGVGVPGWGLRIPGRAPGARADTVRPGVGVGGGREEGAAAKLTLRWGVMGGLRRFGGEGGGVGGEGRPTPGEEVSPFGLAGTAGLAAGVGTDVGGSGGCEGSFGGRKGRCCLFLSDGIMELSAPSDFGVCLEGAGSEADMRLLI